LCIINNPCLYSFFSIIILPLPRSTLFPYTTLFRSHQGSEWGMPHLEPSPQSWLLTYWRGHLPSTFSVEAEELPLSKQQDSQPIRDRKSTRLNSSHSQISYAVFCLKKKTINI